MEIALVQMRSTDRIKTNLAKMEKFLESAVRKGADVVVFPEMAYLSAGHAVWSKEVAAYPTVLQRFQEWALRFNIHLIPGSLREPSPQVHKFFNTLPVIRPSGEVAVCYRKIFLFQAQLPNRRYQESSYCAAGELPMVVRVGDWNLGLAICFDLRFPELFRELRRQDAEVLLVPSAFLHATGKDHWHCLLRARAIENQVYVVGVNQVGTSGEGSRTFGGSAVYDAWGKTIALKPSGEGVLVVNLDKENLSVARSRIDAWACQRDLRP